MDVRDLRFARMGRHLAVAIMLLLIARIAAASQPSLPPDEYQALLRPESRADWSLSGGRRDRDNKDSILTRDHNGMSITLTNQSPGLTGDNICTRRET